MDMDLCGGPIRHGASPFWHCGIKPTADPRLIHSPALALMSTDPSDFLVHSLLWSSLEIPYIGMVFLQPWKWLGSHCLDYKSRPPDQPIRTLQYTMCPVSSNCHWNTIDSYQRLLHIFRLINQLAITTMTPVANSELYMEGDGSG
jgi:hypothetical protein